MSKLLSICIPTYNRDQFLDQALKSIADQPNQDLIEIVVSDNASTDNTLEVIQRWREILPNLVYFRWDANQGADRNFLNVVDISSGKYCWLLGSDDKIIPSAVERLLPHLKESSLLLLDYDLMSYDMKTVIEHRRTLEFSPGTRFTIRDGSDFNRYLAGSQELSSLFAYISTLIVRREDWLATTVRHEFIGSAWIHVTKSLEILCSGGTLTYVGESLVLNRSGNDSFLADVGLIRRILIDLDYIRIAQKVLSERMEMRNEMILWLQKRFFTWRTILSLRCDLVGLESKKTVDEIEYKLFSAFREGSQLKMKRYAWRYTPIILLKIMRVIDRKVRRRYDIKKLFFKKRALILIDK